MRSVPFSAPPQSQLTTPSQIFSYIAEPITNYEQVVRERENTPSENIHVFDFIRGVNRDNFDHGFRWWPKPGDIALRLVSRAFNHAMTRALFRNEYAILRGHGDNALSLVEKHFLSPGGGSRVTSHVTRLRVELSPEDHWQGSIFHAEHSENDQLLGDFAANLCAFFNMHALSSAIANLPRLERLVITADECWRGENFHEYAQFDDYDLIDVNDDSDEKMVCTPLFNLDLLDAMRDNIASVFSSPGNSLEFLTYLRLKLPCTYDFAVIGAQISDAVALQLRHLYLEYIDGTGPHGDLQYTQSWDGDDGSDGSEGYPYSNLQKKFRNTKYMSSVCKLIGRCRNLESLGLAGTQCVDFETLDWQPANHGLKNLYLSRAVMTADKLMQLISPSAEFAAAGFFSNMVAFHIEEVRLLDCMWAKCFEFLLRCDSLKYVHVYNIVYDGMMASLSRHNNRPWENSAVMWSESEEDERELGRLVAATRHRGGSVSKELEEYWEEN
jgi:hypothetical protein